jgi:hypothetical protein
MINIRLFIVQLKLFLLKRELRNNDFAIGGYQEGMVKIIGKRFLNQDEVRLVHKYREEGLLEEKGNWSVVSTSGRPYSCKLYRLKSLS